MKNVREDVIQCMTRLAWKKGEYIGKSLNWGPVNVSQNDRRGLHTFSNYRWNNIDKVRKISVHHIRVERTPYA